MQTAIQNAQVWGSVAQLLIILIGWDFESYLKTKVSNQEIIKLNSEGISCKQ